MEEVGRRGAGSGGTGRLLSTRAVIQGMRNNTGEECKTVQAALGAVQRCYIANGAS